MSTRYLVLYWFARSEDDGGAPRLGIAVPKKLGGSVVRNKMKRRLREAWSRTLPAIPTQNDYVLVAREGLPDATDARGFEWLEERVREVLQKAQP